MSPQHYQSKHGATSQAAPAPRKVRFNIGTQYQVLDVVGKGAYGIVCSAVHQPSGHKVAIKKITPFDHSMFSLWTLQELKLLKFLSEAGISENIISILDIIKPPSLDAFKEVYLIQELMDMHHVIQTQDLSDDHAQCFIYQTLHALKALHSADVIHRDLKPSNLLLNANCDLKTAKPSGTETEFMTEYIMLMFKQYTKAINVWSVGCILAKMLSGKPLFPNYIQALPFCKHRLFAQIFPNANPLTVDFLTKTLTLDPKKCITVEEALAHPYLEAYHDPDDEPVAPPLDLEFFQFDLHKDDISRKQLKELLYEEIISFCPAPIT
ncbi:mitogen-activated protein kinase [Suillus hirtellus]|nr:mitogen-activated protein kinase [Suillus hirtellus]